MKGRVIDAVPGKEEVALVENGMAGVAMLVVVAVVVGGDRADRGSGLGGGGIFRIYGRPV